MWCWSRNAWARRQSAHQEAPYPVMVGVGVVMCLLSSYSTCGLAPFVADEMSVNAGKSRRLFGGWYRVIRQQDGIEQSGKAGIEVLSPEAVDALGAFAALTDNTGLAQDAEMIRHIGLRDVESQRAAWAFPAGTERLDGASPDGIAQGIEHV